MSWLISRAMMEAYGNSRSSPGPVAEFSVGTCSDGEPSAPSSGESTPLAFCAPDRTTAFSRLSRFGVTFKPLTESRGEAVLMSYLAAFPARTSALPERAQESAGSAPGCGATWLGSLGKYDPASRSWKTAQRSFLGDLEESLETWPRSGMTAGGECWELPMLEPPTSETDSGLSVPTPTASGFDVQDVPALLARRERCKEKNKNGNGFGLTLNQWVKVQMWPTPVARDYRSPGRSRLERTGSKAGECLPQVVGGQLNPMWVEWLMGWPLGWTDLKPLGTDKSLSAPPLRGVCFQAETEAA